MVKLGILLIIFSVIFLIVTIADPTILAPLAPLYCPSGQKLLSEEDSFSLPHGSGTSVSFTCSDGTNQTDVSGAITLTTMVIFLGLMFAGIGVITVGASRATRAQQAAATNNPAVNNTMNDFQRGVIRLNGQEVSIADLKSGVYQHQATGDNQRTLADTLSQLEDVHKRGLINDAEYSQLRQDALNKLV